MAKDKPGGIFEQRRAEGVASRKWDAFIPLDNEVANVPPFPLDVFPQALQDLCAQSAASVGCPVDYPASHALAVAAGAIGASFDLQVKRGYWANSNLWVCVVAPPGSGKSPSVAPILAPIYREHGRKRRMSEGPKQHVYVSDVTVERLVQMLNESPRGFLMVWDEMAGWLTSFNQYKAKGAGNDRSHYLSIWDGRTVKVNRVGSKDKNGEPKENWANMPRLSVVGGIQPEVLDSLRAGPSDGLFDRMLFSFPNDHGMAVETWEEISDDACNAWASCLRRLWDTKMCIVNEMTDERRPNTMHLNEDAREMWRNWTIEIADKAKQPEAPTYFRSVGAKIIGYAARLSLVLKRIHEGYRDETEASLPYGVGPDILLKAIGVAIYFLEHAGRVYQASGRDDRVLRAKAIVAWAATKTDPWTQAAAYDALRKNALFPDSDSLDKPLDMLERHGAIRLAHTAQRGPGRPAKGGPYETNPALTKGGAEAV